MDLRYLGLSGWLISSGMKLTGFSRILRFKICTRILRFCSRILLQSCACPRENTKCGFWEMSVVLGRIAKVKKEMMNTIEIYIFIRLDIRSHKSRIRMD